MKFGSWTFNGDQVSLALYNDKNFVDLSDYWKSGTWDIISVPAYLNTYKGEFPTETDITFYIIIRRYTFTPIIDKCRSYEDLIHSRSRKSRCRCLITVSQCDENCQTRHVVVASPS